MQALYRKRSCFSVLFILGILSLFYLGFPPHLQANTIKNLTTGTVSHHNPDLQSFINLFTKDGDRVEATGTFHLIKTLDISKSISLTGSGDAHSLILDGADTNGKLQIRGSVVRISANSSVVMRNLTIQHGGRGIDSTIQLSGGGIVNFGKILQLDNVHIKHNTATFGAGIFSGVPLDQNRNTLIIENCFVQENIAQKLGTGSFPAEGDGGGIYASNCAVFINNSTIGGHTSHHLNHGNSARKRGGGIFLTDSSIMFINGNNKITHNEVGLNPGEGQGGGVYISQDSSANFDGPYKIEHNTATLAGGGIFYFSTSQVTFPPSIPPGAGIISSNTPDNIFIQN